MNKKHIFQKNTLLALIIGIILCSCSKENITPEEQKSGTLEVISVKDLNVLDKGYAYFSLEQQKEVSENTTEWDIKIVGTTISFGNGASGQLVEGIFTNYAKAPTTGYSPSDIAGSNTYYTYTNANEPQHAVLMKPGVLFIIKTGKNKYAKLEMISYYKGNPNVTTSQFANLETRPEKQFFTFNYVLQPNGTTQF